MGKVPAEDMGHLHIPLDLLNLILEDESRNLLLSSCCHVSHLTWSFPQGNFPLWVIPSPTSLFPIVYSWLLRASSHLWQASLYFWNELGATPISFARAIVGKWKRKVRPWATFLPSSSTSYEIVKRVLALVNTKARSDLKSKIRWGPVPKSHAA